VPLPDDIVLDAERLGEFLQVQPVDAAVAANTNKSDVLSLRQQEGGGA